jgi:hypothetical protein
MAATTTPRGGRERSEVSHRDASKEPAPVDPTGGPQASGTADGSDQAGNGRHTAGRTRAAAQQATSHNSVRLSLPVVGQVELPAPDELAFLAGVAVLAVVDAIEWPVAVLLGAGHVLASKRRNKVVREFGEALEKA